MLIAGWRCSRHELPQRLHECWAALSAVLLRLLVQHAAETEEGEDVDMRGGDAGGKKRSDDSAGGFGDFVEHLALCAKHYREEGLHYLSAPHFRAPLPCPPSVPLFAPKLPQRHLKKTGRPNARAAFFPRQRNTREERKGRTQGKNAREERKGKTKEKNAEKNT